MIQGSPLWAWILWTGHLSRAGYSPTSTDRIRRMRHSYSQQSPPLHHRYAWLQSMVWGKSSGLVGHLPSHPPVALFLEPHGIPGEGLKAVAECSFVGVRATAQLRDLLKKLFSPLPNIYWGQKYRMCLGNINRPYSGEWGWRQKLGPDWRLPLGAGLC